MIDTHAHLDFSDFDQDREEVISRAFDNGVKAIINVGVDLERSRKSIELAEKYERVFAAVGIHPEFFSRPEATNQGSIFPLSSAKLDSNSSRSNFFEKLKTIAKNKEVVAIGEAGLDYSRIGDSREIRERQKEGFLRQIKIAQELGLPVIVHCREAWEDVYDIVVQNSKLKTQSHNSKLKTENVKFVLHCYSGEKKDTEKFLKMPNIHFSFSGNITYPKPEKRAKRLAEAVKSIPLDRIMLDSDSPFLAPQEMRGKRNEPTYVNRIADKIANIKDISEEEVGRLTDENANKFFGI